MKTVVEMAVPITVTVAVAVPMSTPVRGGEVHNSSYHPSPPPSPLVTLEIEISAVVVAMAAWSVHLCHT